MAPFIIFTRRPWYCMKRFIIPICLLTTLSIAAIIIAVVLGEKSKQSEPGMIFDIFYTQRRVTVHSRGADHSISPTSDDYCDTVFCHFFRAYL